MKLHRGGADNSTLEISIDRFVEAYDDAIRASVELVSAAIKLQPTPNISIPSDPSLSFFGVMQSDVESLHGAISTGDMTIISEVFSTLSSGINSGPFPIAMRSIGAPLPNAVSFSPSSEEDYVNYAGSLFAIMKDISTRSRKLIPILSKERPTAEKLIHLLVSGQALNTGAGREYVSIDSRTKEDDEGSTTESNLGKYEPTEDLQSAVLEGEQQIYNLGVILKRVKSRVKDMTPEEGMLFIRSLKTLADNMGKDAGALYDTLASEKGNTKAKINTLLVSLAANEIMMLIDAPDGIPKSRAAAVSTFRTHKDPATAVHVLDTEYSDLLEKNRAPGLRSIYNVLKKAAQNDQDITPSDMAAVDQSARRALEADTVSKLSNVKSNPPLEDPNRIGEMKRLIYKESKKISEFIFWRMVNRIPTVNTPSDISRSLFTTSYPHSTPPKFNDSEMGKISIGRTEVAFECTPFNYVPGVSTRGKFNEGLFNKLAHLVNDFTKSKNTPDGALQPPSSPASIRKWYLANDKDGKPSTIPLDRLVKIGASLYSVCEKIPSWKEGGSTDEANYEELQIAINKILSSCVYHSNVGVVVDGKPGVSTLYDLGLESLLSELQAAAKSGNKERFSEGIMAVNRFVLYNDISPWNMPTPLGDDVTMEVVANDDDRSFIDERIKNAGGFAADTNVRKYSEKSTEQIVMMGRSLVYLIKSYFNMLGISAPPSNSEDFLKKMVIDGKGVVDALADSVVEDIKRSVKEHGDGNNIDSAAATLIAEDGYRYIFGVDRNAAIASMYQSLHNNIALMFSSIEESSGRPSSAAQTNQYRDAVGTISVELGKALGVVRSDIFDISASIDKRGGAYRGGRDTISKTYGQRVRDTYSNINSVLNSAAYTSGATSKDITSTSTGRSVIKIKSTVVPMIPSGSTISLLDENGSEITSVECDRKPSVRMVVEDGVQYAKINVSPQFDNVDLSGVRQVRIDYMSMAPDTSGYGLYKIYTGQHTNYIHEIESRLKSLTASVNALLESSREGQILDVVKMTAAIKELEKLRKSIWNTIAILPTAKELDDYSKITKDPQSYVMVDTESVRKILKSMAQDISNFVQANGKFISK